MSKNSAIKTAQQFKDWFWVFNRTRKYKPRKKAKPIIPYNDED